MKDIFFKKQNESNSKLKGINFKIICLIILLINGMLCSALFICTLDFESYFKRYSEISNQTADISRASLILQEASDYLTEEARLFVITRDVKHLENYFTEVEVTRRRENAVEMLRENNSLSSAFEYLEKALEESKKLEEEEYYSMRLMVEGLHLLDDESFKCPQQVLDVKLDPRDAELTDDYKQGKAWLVLFSQSYLTNKKIISDNKSHSIFEILQYSNEIYNTNFNKMYNLFVSMKLRIIFLFILTINLFILIALIIRPLHKYNQCIKNEQKLPYSFSKELNLLSLTYNEMYDKIRSSELNLRKKAEHDGLTGLINRSAIKDIISNLSNSDEIISFVLIDVDYFKEINDTYGHLIGDKVLSNVASTLSSTFRNSDYIARIGGDEFCVIMTKCDPDDSKKAELITQKMNLIREKLASEKELPKVTLSIGIAFSNSGYSQSLYENADVALYEVKRNGKDGYKIFEG